MSWCCISCDAMACWKGSEFAGKDSPAESCTLTSNKGKYSTFLPILFFQTFYDVLNYLSIIFTT